MVNSDDSRRYHSLGKLRATPLEGKRHSQTKITTTVQVSSLPFSVMAELDSFFEISPMSVPYILTFVSLLTLSDRTIPIHPSLGDCQRHGAEGQVSSGPGQTMLVSSNRLPNAMFCSQLEQSVQLRNRLVKHSASRNLEQIFSHVVLVSLHQRQRLLLRDRSCSAATQTPEQSRTATVPREGQPREVGC